MSALNQFLQYSTRTGEPIEHGETTVTPVSRVLSVRLPYWQFIWSRPVSVRVDDGTATSELAIVDITLLIQISMLAISLAAFILSLATRIIRSK